MAEPTTPGWLQFAQSVVPILTAVGGALWAVFVYVDHAAEQARTTARTRLIEAQQPFLKKQLDLYFETAELTGRLVTEDPSTAEYKGDVKRFWALYWASLSMVEHHVVEEAMVQVGGELNAYLAAPTSPERKSSFQAAVYRLAHAIRAGIESSWGAGPASQQIVAPTQRER